MPKNRPVRPKVLLISLTLLLVLCTSGFVVWQSFREHELAIENANRQLLGNARALAEHADQSLAVAERALGSICSDIKRKGGITGLQEQQLHQLLKQEIDGIHQVESALVVDSRGRGIANSHEYPMEKSLFTDREYFRHHRKNRTERFFLGQTVKSRVLGGWVFTISCRLNRPDGSFDGLVAISFKVDYFDQFYQSISTHQQMQTLLLRTDGWPLAVTPSDEKVFKVNIRGKLLLSRYIDETPFGLFRNKQALLDNLDRQIAFARLDHPYENLVAVVSLPRETILADWRRQLAFNVVGALILVSTSVALAVLLFLRLKDLEQKEIEVNTLNERLTLATEAGGIGTWDWDLLRNRLHWDAQMHRLYGLQPQHGPEPYQIFKQAVHPEDQEQVEEALHHALYSDMPLDIEFRILLRDTGELRHLRCIAKVYRNPAEEPLRMVGINMDITGRKQAELYLNLAKEAAEQANRMKSSFIASVSHELRTPLNAIAGMTHLLAESELSTRQREQLDTVDYAARTLLAIINDLLDLSRIEAGRIELEQIPFSLSRLLAEQTAMIGSRAGEKGLLLSSHVASDVPDLLEGDPLRLGQILANLLSNAVKFTEKGGISLTVTLDSRQENELLLCFQVQDSGNGIPLDRLREIFAPFTQSDNSIARRYGGTGLGLAISSQLVKLMGGEIGVESEEGKGSIFFFTIPMKAARPDVACNLTEAAEATDNEPPEPQHQPPVSREQLSPLIKELARHLRRQNMGALNTFRQMSELLQGHFVKELTEIETLLTQLDFAKADQCLRRLAEKLEIPYR